MPNLPDCIYRFLSCSGTHNFSIAQDDVATRIIESDKKTRAYLFFMVHFTYLLFLTKHVVPWKGFESSGSIVIDTRTMDEFIASLDASKDAFLF